MKNLVILVLLTACGTNVEGSWEGTCESDAYEVEIEIDIDEDAGGELSGDGEYDLTQYVTGGSYSAHVTGDVSGTRKGKEIRMSLVDDQGQLFELEMEGEVDGDDIDGSCFIDTVELELELDR